MLNKISLPLQFVLKIFFIATMVNTIVTSAHILTDKDFTYFRIFHVIMHALSVSALFFATVALLIFLPAAQYMKMNRRKLFWIIMGIGILATVAMFTFFRKVFASEVESPEILAAIATFSILVSISSQYQFFTDQKSGEELLDLDK